jgi:hypothetical protein
VLRHASNALKTLLLRHRPGAQNWSLQGYVVIKQEIEGKLSISYFSANLTDFLLQSCTEILGELTKNHRHDLEHQQREAWLAQIDILKVQLVGLPDGVLHFELIIPRMGKRADCVVLLSGIVFVLEFKVNSANFDRYAIDQTHDYPAIRGAPSGRCLPRRAQ